MLLASGGLLLGAGDAASSHPIEAVPSGTILSSESWEIARGLLPDEILELYRRGEYANPILQKPGTDWLVDPQLVEASKRNAGRFVVDQSGTVVERVTGRRPSVITGLPFPDLDPRDPQAGAKVVWNWFYALYWEGSFHTSQPINWLSRDGVQRRISNDVHFKYYDGQRPEDQSLLGDNPLNVLSRTLNVVLAPTDVSGIVSLNWRYRDGGKPDSAWSYLPAVRRIRPINPANRSDGLLGSDVSPDDGPYFDGKPEDFEFTLVGSAMALGHFDLHAMAEGSPVRPLRPDEEISHLVATSATGFDVDVPQYHVIASQDPSWRRADGQGLVAWAPLQWALVPRPVWVVEARPKNPYYLYGKQVLLLDRDTFRGYWKNKYDWRGRALVNWAMAQCPLTKVADARGLEQYVRTGAGGNIALAVNFAQDRATASGMPVKRMQYRVQIPDDIFATARIVRQGK